MIFSLPSARRQASSAHWFHHELPFIIRLVDDCAFRSYKRHQRHYYYFTASENCRRGHFLRGTSRSSQADYCRAIWRRMPSLFSRQVCIVCRRRLFRRFRFRGLHRHARNCWRQLRTAARPRIYAVIAHALDHCFLHRARHSVRVSLGRLTHFIRRRDFQYVGVIICGIVASPSVPVDGAAGRIVATSMHEPIMATPNASRITLGRSRVGCLRDAPTGEIAIYGEPIASRCAEPGHLLRRTGISGRRAPWRRLPARPPETA